MQCFDQALPAAGAVGGRHSPDFVHFLHSPPSPNSPNYPN